MNTEKFYHISKTEAFEEHVKKIRAEIKEIDVKDVVKRHFWNRFKEEEIDAALKDIEFVIRNVENFVSGDSFGYESKNTGASHNSVYSEKIQDWVKRIFRYLLNNRLLTIHEIYRLHDVEYSKKTFGVAYAMFVDTQKNTIISGHARYWQTPICGYYICSQWWKSYEQEYDFNIRQWLRNVVPDYISVGLERR